jgi:glutaredoxin
MKCLKILFFLLVLPLSLQAQPKIAISKAFWSIGSVNKGVILDQTLTIKNNGNEALKISVRGSCPCLSITPEKAVIKQNENVDLNIAYDSKELSLGKKSEYIFIDTNDPEHESISWLIEADIIGQTKDKGVQAVDKKQQVAGQNTEQSKKTTDQIQVEIYSTPGCSYCKKLKGKILPDIINKHNLNVHIHEFLLSDKENYERFVLLENKLNSRGNKLPAVVAGGKIFGGEKIIESDLENYLAVLKDTPSIGQSLELPVKNGALAKQEVSGRINSMKVIPIIVAALLDGINPCAFAGIIFLVAYLSMVQKRSFQEVFWTGIMYILGIFVIYFLIGVGLAKVFVALSVLKYVSKTIYIIMGCLTLVLSYYSFQDYFALKAAEEGKDSKVTLQLPAWLKLKIHDFIHKYSNVKYLIPFGFCLGVVVSFLEFFCTGQIYLPTIMYMVSIPEMAVKAVFYLLLYTFVFTLPLVVIFIMVLISSKSGRMQAMSRKQVQIIKLLTGFLFLLLSILMFVFVS